jgi:hypothetical protein
MASPDAEEGREGDHHPPGPGEADGQLRRLPALEGGERGSAAEEPGERCRREVPARGARDLFLASMCVNLQHCGCKIRTRRWTEGRNTPMSICYRLLIIASLLLGAECVGAQDTPETPDPLAPLQVLEGVWQGEGHGFGQTSRVTHEWRRVLGGKFLRLTTKSVATSDDGTESIHEDVGYVSWSEGEHILRFRQFLSEGFVNTFRIEEVESPAAGFNFEPESTEGDDDLVARMTLRFDPSGGYEMILELGTKGKPLKACQTMKLERIR